MSTKELMHILASLLFFILLVGASSKPARGEELSCQFIALPDADTIYCHTASERRDIRILGIDAPEIKQTCSRATGEHYNCGMVAKHALENFIVGKRVTCTTYKKDIWGRRDLGTCYADGADIGAYLLQEGHAIVLMYNKFEKQLLGHYHKLEADAKEKRKGIYAGTFQTPKEYRKSQRKQGSNRKSDM